MAASGQAVRQAPQRVQRSGELMTACLRCPEVSKVIRRCGQAATQRPQPEQRVVSTIGVAFGSIRSLASSRAPRRIAIYACVARSSPPASTAENNSLGFLGRLLGIAEQVLLFPFLNDQLLLAQRIVARAGGDQGKRRLLARAPTTGAELVGSGLGLGRICRVLGHGLPWGPVKLSAG